MEQVHGVDVSWMAKGAPKDRINGKISPPLKTPSPPQAKQIPAAVAALNLQENGQIHDLSEAVSMNGPNQQRRGRSGSIDKGSTNGTPPGRRNSWFSNISAKFSATPTPNPISVPQANHQHHLFHHNDETYSPPLTPATIDPPMPKASPSKNAVLQPATKPDGDGPYTPAPPKSSQAGLLGVFRRLSASTGGSNLGPAGKIGHGLVDRKVLNVDKSRERCPISELKDAKLRRVSFCVDVEIAPMPKYADEEIEPKPIDKTIKKKLTEKGEGEALKNPGLVADKVATIKEESATPQAFEREKARDNSPFQMEQKVPRKPLPASAPQIPPIVPQIPTPSTTTAAPSTSPTDTTNGGTTKKKEKKKKSEEERKARKEKKRKLAEANGSVPMELHYDTSDSSSNEATTGTGTPRTMHAPTTNPVRIYRRCCQLRETPILKKITEQLLDPTNASDAGVVSRLDLTGYWLQLPDLITLGDYLAVVPVREIVLENIGLTDEGLRVILAGLLASKQPNNRRRKPKHEWEEQGGVIERVVLKNNKLGSEGWKHLSLFLFLCRSLKYLDISHIPFPKQAPRRTAGNLPNGLPYPPTIAELFSKALSERLAGPTLELVNIGDTEPSMEQLGTIVDGLIQCGVSRLGLAHNKLDSQGVEHVVRYLAAGKCEGLDLGGNDLADHMDKFAAVIKENDPVWALSLSGCNLKPSSLCKILPVLVKLKDFRFIDLSHNHDLFESTPNAVSILRRYLPKMPQLKRIHLQDVGMTSEHAIALAEILPEVTNLAHVNMLENTELVKLGSPKSEEAQEEACALYASLIAAARVSTNLIAVDIEVPSDEASEIVKAMAKQVVAYCLRNMERLQDISPTAAIAFSEAQNDSADIKEASYPDVIAHLVGHDVLDEDEVPDDTDSAPDEDYVIGGTGVVKALTACLKNRASGDDTEPDELVREVQNGEAPTDAELQSGGKAKDMSKHLLAGARKIRRRLQPALIKAKANPGNENEMRKLVFLDETLQGIIKRFEDEYPDTRENYINGNGAQARNRKTSDPLSSSPPTTEEYPPAVSDEEEAEIHPSRPLSRSNSMLSKTQAEEEGRVMRAGHRFRSDYLTQQRFDILTIDDIGGDPKHLRLLDELAEETGGHFLELVKQKGTVRAFKEDKEVFYQQMRESDPEHWERFQEAQQKARANVGMPDSAIED